MKKTLSIGFLAVAVYLLSSGFSQGTALVGSQNRTGSFGSQASCGDAGGACHSPNDANMVVHIDLRDVFGNPVNNSRYWPNAYYWVKISGRASGNLPAFGYQFSVQGQNGNGGTYVPSGNRQTSVIGSAVVLEPINSLYTVTSVGVNNDYIDSFLWQAPPAGSGQLTLFATALLANDDFSKSGDKSNNAQRNLFPQPTDVAEFDASVAISVFPNPATSYVQVQVGDRQLGDYSVRLADVHGRVVLQQTISGNGPARIDVSQLADGNYFLELASGSRRKVIPLVKR